MNLDVLAIGAHPDDADLGVGGTLLLLARQGYRVGILDLTRGELASRGTVEERAAEAAEAATRLGLTLRENAGLPDGALENSIEQRRVIAGWIRRLRPHVILAQMAPDRHPDHVAAAALVRAANFDAGIYKVAVEGAVHRAQLIHGYSSYYDTGKMPSFLMDISSTFEAKLEALRAFRSQLFNSDYAAPETYVASEAFWNDIRTRAAYWGARAGVAYAEPFYNDVPPLLGHLPGLRAADES